MDDNFALFGKYPHYVFNFSGANRYRLLKEYYPADFAKLTAQGWPADVDPTKTVLLEKPTLAQPLRSASAREEGDSLVLEVAPDFYGMAASHADEYRELARTHPTRHERERAGRCHGPVPDAAPCRGR